MKRKAMITWFVIVFVICFTGIFASTIMIDNLIDSYIEEIKTTVDIEIINNTTNEVVIEDNDEEIIKAIDYCHLYGVKIYVTVNTTIYENEIKDVIVYFDSDENVQINYNGNYFYATH